MGNNKGNSQSSFCCCFCSTIGILTVIIGITLVCLWQFVGFETPGTNYQITLDGQGLLDSAAYTEGIPVEVNVQVSNPNSYALDANKIQADIRVPDADNTLIASVKHGDAIHIPKQETASFDMSGSVKYSTSVATLLAQSCSSSKNNQVDIDTVVSFNVWSIFPIKLPAYQSSLDCGELINTVADGINDVGDKIQEVAAGAGAGKAPTAGQLSISHQSVEYKDIHIPGQKLATSITVTNQNQKTDLAKEKVVISSEDENPKLRKRA